MKTYPKARRVSLIVAQNLSHNGDMDTLDTLRAERREEILRLAGRRGAHSLRVFGSVARGEANENSDLDLLVAWEPGRSLLDHAGLDSAEPLPSFNTAMGITTSRLGWDS